MAGSITSVQRLVPGLIEQLGSSRAGQPDSANIGDPKFSELIADLIDSVNQAQNESAQVQQAFLTGEPVELHEVMIKAEEAGISMDLLLEIRNRLLSGYQELMRMPM